ncbi:MAG: hypothetical protein B7Y15_08740 [Bacteroidetes bacterium 24-39-8]|nr:MAG: hypothetical protein B7Y15_08740 [Bacteroidetes bacterium 24-39-8]OZA67903.1 MAG: hypothetical protein B7X72_02785 [Sphingobacteriia bacterium 39-39-8]HQR92344.1 lysoplasmalogenase [Sediminibacterium sp.]HQS55487.1 lysoplasmalogenase [Sediminibacterium sp.]
MILKKYGPILFLLLLLLHCLSIAFEWSEIRFFSKLALVPFLMFILAAFNGLSFKNQSWLPWLGLLGAFAGDWLLATPGEIYFLLGMLGFMTTHVCNSLYFLKLQPLQPGKLKPAMIAMIVLVIFCSLIVFQIKDQLGTMLLPIMAYMGIISLMTILAANLAASESLNRNAIKYFIPGAAFFVASDGLLALNKFLLHNRNFDIPVMITYGLAILLLTLGFVNTAWLAKKIPSNGSRG